MVGDQGRIAGEFCFTTLLYSFEKGSLTALELVFWLGWVASKSQESTPIPLGCCYRFTAMPSVFTWMLGMQIQVLMCTVNSLAHWIIFLIKEI